MCAMERFKDVNIKFDLTSVKIEVILNPYSPKLSAPHIIQRKTSI
jgi:hypothetical protein